MILHVKCTVYVTRLPAIHLSMRQHYSTVCLSAGFQRRAVLVVWFVCPTTAERRADRNGHRARRQRFSWFVPQSFAAVLNAILSLIPHLILLWLLISVPPGHVVCPRMIINLCDNLQPTYNWICRFMCCCYMTDTPRMAAVMIYATKYRNCMLRVCMLSLKSGLMHWAGSGAQVRA